MLHPLEWPPPGRFFNHFISAVAWYTDGFFLLRCLIQNSIAQVVLQMVQLFSCRATCFHRCLW
jgi:hypothetical protein